MALLHLAEALIIVFIDEVEGVKIFRIITDEAGGRGIFNPTISPRHLGDK